MFWFRSNKLSNKRNQPKEQGFRKSYSTTDHLQALNKIAEKSNEYNLPLCVGFIDYEKKTFDTVEHFAIFEALRKSNKNETHITCYKTFTTKLQQGSIEAN